jgi:hypothetical protein
VKLAAHFTTGIETRLMLFDKTARMADKAKPSKPSDLADVAETRDPQGGCFRFGAARADARGDYHPRPRTFARSPMKSAAAIFRRDLPDLDSV